jgi:putative glutamine amidotransferase
MKPLIGMNGLLESDEHGEFFKLRRPYVDAVVAAGGIPVMLPLVRSRADAEEVLSRVDGVLLTGGDDFDPKRLGVEDYPGRVPTHPDKEASDFFLAEVLLHRSQPTLGVCYGEQLLNVAAGGSLVLDIPSELDAPLRHWKENGQLPNHEVALTGRIAELLGTAATANSSHHQSVKTIADGWIVAGTTSDGVIEAIERPDHPFMIGVQWHPEKMPAHHALFDALVAACTVGT